MEELSPFEYRAIETIASADVQHDILLAQLAVAKCISRDYTGVGLYVEISVPPAAPQLDLARWKIEDLPKGHAEHPALPAGAGLILWIKNGFISCLECHTYDGGWPDNEALFKLSA